MDTLLEEEKCMGGVVEFDIHILFPSYPETSHRIALGIDRVERTGSMIEFKVHWVAIRKGPTENILYLSDKCLPAPHNEIYSLRSFVFISDTGFDIETIQEKILIRGRHEKEYTIDIWLPSMFSVKEFDKGMPDVITPYWFLSHLSHMQT